jgi:FtsP/CotA-like multicopper oxidase with cupredoxin domain
MMKAALSTAAIVGGALLAALPAGGQTGRTNALPIVATNFIPPTVTAAMGDVGGKFFGGAPDAAKTRHYYVAAEPELWDYAPQGRDPVCGKPLPPPVAAQRSGGKIRYVQYTDETFGAKVIQNPRLGILGPVLRGVAGEFLAVTFVNRTSRPLSMHPHGVKYDKDSEGSYYQPKPGLGAAVEPGAKFTYVWQLDDESAPLPTEPSSKAWLYHSHVNGDEEANLGLVGFIVVTDPNRSRPDGTPVDVEREMAALFMIFDESGLGEQEKEAAEYANLPGGFPAKPWAQVQELLQQGERHAINGYIFGNLPGLEMNEGERVRWYLFGLGSKEDFHSAHWHGLRVVEDGRRRTDNVELLPATMKVADMVADNPGSWLFHCHVAEHMMEGMFARVIVHRKGAGGASRSPDQAFFGLRQAQQSLQIKRADATLDFAPTAAQPCTLSIEGVVTVFQAFSVFTQTVQLRVGDRSVTFKPDRRGTATTADGSFRVKNASQFGVVYGGLMGFEATLTGPEWLREFQRLGANGAGVRAQSVPTSVTMQIGQAQHTAKTRIDCQFGPSSR